jgi:hypothetical protein
MVGAPELYTPLSIFDVMMRSDDEAILARNTCVFNGGKYYSIVGSFHSTKSVRTYHGDKISNILYPTTCWLSMDL